MGEEDIFLTTNFPNHILFKLIPSVVGVGWTVNGFWTYKQLHFNPKHLAINEIKLFLYELLSKSFYSHETFKGYNSDNASCQILNCQKLIE